MCNKNFVVYQTRNQILESNIGIGFRTKTKTRDIGLELKPWIKTLKSNPKS